jgi:hypothetical protein
VLILGGQTKNKLKGKMIPLMMLISHSNTPGRHGGKPQVSQLHRICGNEDHREDPLQENRRLYIKNI